MVVRGQSKTIWTLSSTASICRETLIVFLLWLLGAGNVLATTLAIDSPRFHINITDKLEYLEDSTLQLKAEDTVNPNISKQFTPSHHKALQFGFTDHVIWTRFTIANNKHTPLSAILHIDRTNIDQINLYEVSNNQIRPINNITTPEALPQRTPVFEIILGASQEKQIIARLASSHFLNAAIHLSDPLTFSTRHGKTQSLIGLGAGILICFTLYGLFAQIRTKQKLFIGYSLYSASVLLYLLTLTGYLGTQWLGLPELQAKFEASCLLLTISAMCVFDRYLLDTKKYTPYLDLIYLAIIVLSLLAVFSVPFISSKTAMQASFSMGIICTPVLLFAIFTRWINDFKPARYYLLSRALLLIVTAIGVQKVFGDPLTNISLTLLLINCFLLDTVLISFALTERQRELQKQSEQQQQHIAIAEAVTRTKSEFLAQLSHEIRTPMNGILGMTELLNGTPLSHTQQDYLKTIFSSGSHLLKILDDVLDFSKIEAGKMSIDISAFDISNMLTECIEAFKGRIEEKHLELITHIDSDVPPQVKGDPIRIRQVLTNLISNAVRYTDHGEIVINIKKDPQKSNHHILFEVNDTGIGLSADSLKLLFNPDQSIDPAESKGLGLAISQRLIHMMSGDINGTSQQGKGSTFWFSIPLEAVDEQERAPILTDKLHDLRLLVVDDNASCRLVIQQQANSWGMQVSTAVNGKQAMALLRSQANLEEPFDIVILDHEMPGMNGLELAARIKEDQLINNNLLVIMLTGLGVAPSSTAARNAGIRKVITKPVTGRMLKITLAEELGHLQKIEQEHPDQTQTNKPLPSRLAILVAEDHYLSQKVIKGMLARLGLECDTVSNGKDAINAARKKNYSLILMDCEMPDVSGFDATLQIRRWEKANNRKEVPIIALTAHIMDEHKERSLECGMNAHLSKPIELPELRDVIIRWTNSRPGKVQSITKGMRA